MVPPGSKRQRSRLHQTPGSAPPGATLEDLSPHPVRHILLHAHDALMRVSAHAHVQGCYQLAS